LDAVQVLTDLDLSIKKAYISADGKWCMDGKLIVLSFPFLIIVLVPVSSREMGLRHALTSFAYSKDSFSCH